MFLLVLLGFGPAHADQWEKVEIKQKALSKTVTMLTGRGGNMALSVGPEAVVLVDDQFAPLTEKIQAAIAERTARPVDFVLNTHWHGDHTGGNENFGRAGALIFAHERVRERLLDRHFAEQAGGFLEDPRLPVVTFSEAISFHLNGEEIRVLHVQPAHTDGDAIVHFTGSDVIHLGDVFFNGLYSFFDRGSGGSFTGMIAALEQGLALAGPRTKIIPGHGPLASRFDLAEHIQRLKEIRARTLRAIEAGQSKEDFIASQPTADLEAAFLGRYKVMPAEKFLGLVYDDLAKK